MAPIGGLLLTLTFDRFGRKKNFFGILLISLAGWIVLSTANSTNRTAMLTQILIGRALNGISHGMATGATSVYLSEMAVAKVRGRIFVLLTIMTTIGILIVYISGYFMPVKIY